jgi:hypothetical protein
MLELKIDLTLSQSPTGAALVYLPEGTAELMSDGRLKVRADNLEPLSPDGAYAVWLVQGEDSAITLLGELQVDGYATLKVASPRFASATDAILVTIEPRGATSMGSSVLLTGNFPTPDAVSSLVFVDAVARRLYLDGLASARGSLDVNVSRPTLTLSTEALAIPPPGFSYYGWVIPGEWPAQTPMSQLSAIPNAQRLSGGVHALPEGMTVEPPLPLGMLVLDVTGRGTIMKDVRNLGPIESQLGRIVAAQLTLEATMGVPTPGPTVILFGILDLSTVPTDGRDAPDVHSHGGT